MRHSWGVEAELGTDGPKVILVAIDGSTTSMRAGSYAAGLARRQGSRLVVAHVVHPPTMVMAPQAPAALEAAEEVLEQLRSEVERGAAWVGFDVEFRTAYGNPYGELLKLAEEVRAELVVLGASE